MPTFEPLTGRELLTRRAPLALLAILLASCQTPPPVYQVEEARSYAKAKPVVWDEILVFLERYEISPVRADPAAGRLEAERHAFEDMGWADCERAWVTDNTSNSPRPTRAHPVARDLNLRIALQETGGTTEVGLAARFTEEQIDPYRNMPFTQPCRSKGVLEKALLDAL
jgi:hypothetical protein